MPERTGKKKSQSELGVIVDLVHTINDTFEALTGKTVPAWLREFQQQPREFQQQPRELLGEQTVSQEEPAAMSLANAYAILGLPQTVTLEEVKGNYKRLAAVFHPDKGGYTEAMVLLNRAYERIKGEKGGN